MVRPFAGESGCAHTNVTAVPRSAGWGHLLSPAPWIPPLGWQSSWPDALYKGLYWSQQGAEKKYAVWPLCVICQMPVGTKRTCCAENSVSLDWSHAGNSEECEVWFAIKAKKRSAELEIGFGMNDMSLARIGVVLN